MIFPKEEQKNDITIAEDIEDKEEEVDEEGEEEEDDDKEPKKNRCQCCRTFVKTWAMKNNILSPYLFSHPYLNRIERALITGTSFMLLFTITSVIQDISEINNKISNGSFIQLETFLITLIFGFCFM